jgi:hypothetical protein
MSSPQQASTIANKGKQEHGPRSRQQTRDAGEEQCTVRECPVEFFACSHTLPLIPLENSNAMRYFRTILGKKREQV